MNSKFKLAIGSIAVALSLGLTVPANAVILTTTLGVGVSKDNQNAPPVDLTSKFGASIAGSTLSYNTVTGEFTAHIENVGPGNVTTFGVRLNPDVFGDPLLAHTFSFVVDSCPVNDCLFSDSTPPGGGVVDGFGNTVDFSIGIGAKNDTTKGPPAIKGNDGGLETGESADLVWGFDPTKVDLSTVKGDFFKLVDPQTVKNDGDCTSGNGEDCVSFKAFWVAQVQELEGGASDHIGGAKGNPGIVDVPEPGILLLLGAGLASLGIVGLRRKRPWIN